MNGRCSLAGEDNMEDRAATSPKLCISTSTAMPMRPLYTYLWNGKRLILITSTLPPFLECRCKHAFPPLNTAFHSMFEYKPSHSCYMLAKGNIEQPVSLNPPARGSRTKAWNIQGGLFPDIHRRLSLQQ
ncbi:hypothetical protein ACRALDRAFT_2021847 [Sodiomyces alcalophilus JCM 7366]|uniref:uncharacterized protein n=1 Tax=Sodiomyces alcalophilus JCM 7366 TaxID=591952 RepID=UPI0039B49BCF